MALKRDKTSRKRLARFTVSGKRLRKGVRNVEKNTLRHAHRFVLSRLDRLSEIRRYVMSWVVLVMLLVGVSAAQWMLSRQAFTNQAYQEGGTFSEGVLGPLETLNPIFARSSAEKSAARLLFASLYQYDESGHLKADLAEKLSINDAETEYIIKLRPHTKWSDGAPLTAEDVLFTIALLKNPEAKAEISGWNVVDAQLVDKQTIKLTIPAPYAPFMHALTFPVLPKHSLAEVKASQLREHGFSRAPITSGPFALRLLQDAAIGGTKKILYMIANPYYHHGRPKLERFQLYAYESLEEVQKGLKLNEIIATPELVYQKLPEDMQRLYSKTAYSVNNGAYALFNTQSPMVHSQKVRRALALSIDTAELRKQLPQSTNELTGPLIAGSITGEIPAGPGYNPQEAAALLDQDGWPLVDGVRRKEDKELTLSVVALKDAKYEKTVEYLKAKWQELGIKVEARVVDPADIAIDVIQSVLQPRNFDVLIYELVLGGDPDVFAYWHSSQVSLTGLNFANYNNAISDEALNSGRAKFNPKQRAERYRAFARKWQADTPALALYQSKIDYIQSPIARTISEGAQLVSSTDRYANVIHWTVKKATVYKTP